MAKSKAKRMREKLIREGNRNPESGRGTFALADMRTRITKTKQQKLNQAYRKERKSRYGGDSENVVLFHLVS